MYIRERHGWERQEKCHEVALADLSDTESRPRGKEDRLHAF